MSFINNISIRKIVIAVLNIAAMAGFLVSCVQIEDNDGSKGYLSFSSLSVDVSVEGLELTKASVPAANVPDASDFTYTIVCKTDGLTYYSEEGLPAEPISLPVGTYRVDAVYGANEFNQAYYAASIDNVQITEGVTNNIDLGNVQLSNAMVAVTLPDLTGHMEVSSISISDGTTSIPVESGKYYFVPVGPSITVSFAGINSLGESKSFSVPLEVLEAHHAYDVVCNLELPSFTFADQSSGAIAGRLYLTSLASLEDGLDASKVKYEISADGGASWKTAVPVAKDGYWVINQTSDGDQLESDGTTYSIRAVYGGMIASPGAGQAAGAWTFQPSMPVNTVTGASISQIYESRSFAGLKSPLSVLTGSTATVSGTDVAYPDIVASLIASKGSRGAELVNSSGNVVRTLSSKETGSMTKEGEWDYLPQDVYTLKPYFLIGDQKVYLGDIPAERSTPDITVTAYAETSYSRYLNYKAGVSGYTVDKANTSGTAEKVMDIRGIVSISDEILGKYSALISNVSLKYEGTSLMAEGTKVAANVWYPDTHATRVNDTSWEITGQSWGSHNVTATFTFDGVAAKSSYDAGSTTSTLACHITGLPYKIRTEGATPSGWTTSNTTRIGVAGDYMCMKNGDAYAISPEFHIPSNTGVQVSVDAYAYKGTSGTYNTYVYFSASSTGEKNGQGQQVAVSSDYPVSNPFANYSGNISFTQSISQACIFTSGVRNKEWWGVDGFTPSVIVENVYILYSN